MSWLYPLDGFRIIFFWFVRVETIYFLLTIILCNETTTKAVQTYLLDLKRQKRFKRRKTIFSTLNAYLQNTSLYLSYWSTSISVKNKMNEESIPIILVQVKAELKRITQKNIQ